MKVCRCILLGLVSLACVPNFTPESSNLGPIEIQAEFADLIPSEAGTDGFEARLTLYCYDTEKDSLVGKVEVLPGKTETEASLKIRQLERGRKYTVAVFFDYRQIISEDYGKQRWYHIHPEKRSDFHLERISDSPSACDVLGYFLSDVYPEDKPLLVNLSSLGKAGRVVIDNYDKTEAVSWSFSSAFRFAPFNPYAATRKDKCTSFEPGGWVFYVSDGTTYTEFKMESKAAGSKSALIDLSPYRNFVIRADAITGTIHIEGL